MAYTYTNMHTNLYTPTIYSTYYKSLSHQNVLPIIFNNFKLKVYGFTSILFNKENDDFRHFIKYGHRPFAY